MNQPSGNGAGPDGYPPSAAAVPWPGLLPCLHLYPVNDSFLPKLIQLPPGSVHVKIGRQTSAKTVPDERNGYFDTKVLSRTHAEVWEEGGKIYIKDVKSSNGTFVNGERLSAEATESEAYELKSEDYVEFGIDICGDDNKTIVHHKVSSKVYCVLGPQDVEASARELQEYNQAMSRLANMRRGNSKPVGPNVNDLTRQLANELQKSRETAVDLHNLHNAMNDIHETLGGGNLPPQIHAMHPSGPSHAGSNAPQPSSEVLQYLQARIDDNQLQLYSNLGRVQTLEGRLSEHELIKKEVEDLRDRLGSLQGQLEFKTRRALIADEEADDDVKDYHHTGEDEEDEETEEEEEEDDSDDDARSVQTVKEGDEGRAGGRGIKRRRGNGSSAVRASYNYGEVDNEREGVYRGSYHGRHGRSTSDSTGRATLRDRPSTPEPGGISSSSHLRSGSPNSLKKPEEDEEDDKNARGCNRIDEELKQQLQEHVQQTQTVLAQNIALTTRLDLLGSELDGVLGLSKLLQDEHSTALSTVSLLETRVAELEGQVGEVQGKWEVWKEKMEETWKKERDSWDSERERMKSVVKEWEEAKRRAEEEEEERRLNGDEEDEEPEDDLRWGNTDPTDKTGRKAFPIMGSNGPSPDTTNDPNGTIGALASRTLGKQLSKSQHQNTSSDNGTIHARSTGSSSSTASSSSSSVSAGVGTSSESRIKYSSLRTLLNPLYTLPQSSITADNQTQRGHVPSSFIRGAAAPSSQLDSSSSSSGFSSNGEKQPLKKGASSGTTQGSLSESGAGRKPSASLRAGSGEGALGDVSEGEVEDENVSVTKRATAALGGGNKKKGGPEDYTFTPMQLQGVVVVGVAVVLAFNYDKLSQFIKG
ncbi:FOG: FHA domain [Phaffia rhodozyma]|uniref:FOG: FHA domain n=1 Tax=Phaffia rhodozyma TaxID=264483 RepID=A0A0F7SUG3_PHARH|nr:FOG: FHA domain [Phaffia rhodozyma]